MNYDDIVEADNLLNKRRDCIAIIDDLNSNEYEISIEYGIKINYVLIDQDKAKKFLLESLNDKKEKFEARLKELGVDFETRRGQK